MRNVFQWVISLSLICFSAVSVSASRDFIIDTDMAVDDVIALVYFLERPHINVKAIIIDSNGAAHCEDAYANLLGLLKQTHHASIPIACGRLTSLQGDHDYPIEIKKDSDNLAGMAPSLKILKKPVLYHGEQLLYSVLSSAHHSLSILALGPLTNIASVIKAHPAVIKNIERIYFMGGAIYVPGNIHAVAPYLANEKAEWNIYMDPLAAQEVIASSIPMTIIPLDSCQQIAFDEDFYKEIQQKHVTYASQFVYRLLSKNPETLKHGDWYFWDPLAAIVANKDELEECESLPLIVKTNPEEEAGNLLIDHQKGRTKQVCLFKSLNLFDLKKHFLNALNTTQIS